MREPTQKQNLGLNLKRTIRIIALVLRYESILIIIIQGRVRGKITKIWRIWTLERMKDWKGKQRGDLSEEMLKQIQGYKTQEEEDE